MSAQSTAGKCTVQDVLRDWEAVIGLEVHTELTTLNTKMFCSCPIEFGAEPNTQVCPICLGLPGALGVPNKAAIQSIVLAGLATDCQIMKQSMFYRKNYVYADMTKNFQTTQGPVAFCMDGKLDLEVSGEAAKEREQRDGTEALVEPEAQAAAGSGDTQADTGDAQAAAGDAQANAGTNGYTTRIGITRIHMEEDTGKLVHIGGVDGRITGATHSLVDYNRCGLPLIELVTEPDLRTPEEARLFLQKLRSIYLTLGISDCSMEEGSLRCDGNISLRRRGTKEFGTKTELKNMNSFKNLHDGLAYEIVRQAEVLESGGTVRQETRHWEPATKRTISMRVKETADDYRYFPEPDLAPFDLSDEFIKSVRARLPELPEAKKTRYIAEYGLSAADAGNLAADAELAAFFDAAVGGNVAGDADSTAVWGEGAADGDPGRAAASGSESSGASGTTAPTTAPKPSNHAKAIANLLLNDVTAYLNAEGLALAAAKFTPAQLAELVELQATDAISSKQSKEVLAAMCETGQSPHKIVEERGMKQVSDAGALEAAVLEVLAANPDKVAQYQGGKAGLIGFFVGQVMKATAGQGNPKLINEILSKHLDGE